MSHTSISSGTEKKEGVELGVEVGAAGDTEVGKIPIEAIANNEEHPKGFKLAMVILALVLSVFLVALDLVY